jgi:hypothetical protein
MARPQRDRARSTCGREARIETDRARRDWINVKRAGMIQWWTEERISQVDGSSIGTRGQAQADCGRYEEETNED